MTPESLPELETKAFRRAIAAALGLPVEGAPPRSPARGAAAWDPLGSVELDAPAVGARDAAHGAVPDRREAAHGALPNRRDAHDAVPDRGDAAHAHAVDTPQRRAA
jgi:hypothetical protein